MTYALVGSVGAVSVGASGAAVTPAWGTGENRTANNLLVCWVAGSSATAPSTPSGWSVAIQRIGTAATATVFYLVAAGSDAAPTIAAATSTVWSVQLAEFSGNATSSVVDATDSTDTTTSPAGDGGAVIDAAAGELVLVANSIKYTQAGTKTFSDTLNNGATANTTNNAGTSTANHYDFCYGITTSNSVATTESFSFTTTKISDCVSVFATMKLGTVVTITIPQTIMGPYLPY